jgi:hypothetical protein
MVGKLLWRDRSPAEERIPDCPVAADLTEVFADSGAGPVLGGPSKPACQYTEIMVRPVVAVAVILAAELALACSITSMAPPPSRPSGEGLAAMPENADRQALEPLLRAAIGDLARRLNIDPGEVRVVEADAIVWPDRSLGCPRPGMAYAQVPQDGALIRLQAQGHVFAYHSGGGRAPFLCCEQL